MADEDQDRSEAATPFKLDEARRRGVVAKSPEVNTAAAMLSGLLAIAAFGPWISHRLLSIAQGVFAAADHPAIDPAHLQAWLGGIGRQVLFALSPLFALVVCAGVVANILQSGPVFSAEPLKPDFDRLNPASGFKRLFSAQALFNAIKTLLKFLIFITIGYLFLHALIHQLPGLYRRALSGDVDFFGASIRHFLSYLVVGAIVVAVADLIFTRWEFARRMRMSRREFKDEVRRREGDPNVRRRRREVQRELRRRAASVGKVKGADFVVTNPQHIAVALKYRRGRAVAPEVIAKGAGDLAAQIRAVAFRYRVPVVPNPPLARALYRDVRIGRPIPERYYGAVAEILRWVYQVRHRQNDRSAA